MIDSYTLGILKDLEKGEINAEQANARLRSTPGVAAPAFKPELPRWVYGLRVYPLLSGTLIVLFGAWIIVSTVHANILWFLLGLPVVLLGALILSVGSLFYSAHWLYLIVEKSRGRPRTIRFAVPFPFGLLRVGFWFARFVKPNSKSRVNVSARNLHMDGIWDDVGGFLKALEQESKEGRGISVNIDDKGQRVQLYWLEPNAFKLGASDQSHTHLSQPGASQLDGNQFLFGSDDEIDGGWRKEWAGF